MTVEIGILNKEVVAIAADSAVTVSRGEKQKIFTSANKIFALSKYHPVGIMVYGSSLLMRIPWETIIKVYRKKLVKTKFNTLEEYAKDFIDYLNNQNKLFPPEEQEKYLTFNIQNCFYQIVNEIEKKIDSAIQEKKEKKITEEDAVAIITGVIKHYYDTWEQAEALVSVKDDSITNLRNKYGKIIDSVKKEIFQDPRFSEELLNQLTKIAENLFIKCPKFMVYDSGIVIAGFGEEDVFPSIISYYIDGIVNNRLVYKEDVHSKIDFNKNSSIVPFAQRNEIKAFIEGIDPTYKSNILGGFSKIFNIYPEVIIDAISKLTDEEKKELKEKTKKSGSKIFGEFVKEINDFQRVNFVSPITRIVSSLPKDELAAMAETLINLTSFKRKISEQAETVGGPIDVAVISKGDGFVWIKRKHYFKPELNPHFSKNYYMEE